MSENIELMMPIKAAPYDYQKKAFAFACDKFGVFDNRLKSRGTALLMEMGTSKTIVSIAVSGCMYQYGLVNRVLVVAPLSILGVWEEEFEKFADFPYSLTILKGTSAKKKEQLTKLPTEGLQIVVVNYESAWRLEKELLAYNADLVVADEAHKLKENRTSQSKGMHHIGDKAKYKLLLTGTVITNRELDVFSQYRFLNPQVFGTSFYAFRNQYFDMGGYGNHTPIFRKWMTDDFNRRLADVSSQLDKVFEQFYFEMDEEEAKAHMMRLVYHMLGVVNEIRIISNARIKKDCESEELCIERQKEAEKFLSRKVAAGLDQLLSNENLRLDLNTSRELFSLTGGGVRLNGEYVPVQAIKIDEMLKGLAIPTQK